VTVAELTADAIDAMPAGQTMDVLVAGRVLGWRFSDGGIWWPSDEGYYGSEPPRLSTDIREAWRAAELFPEFHLRRVHWADTPYLIDDRGNEVPGTHGEVGGYQNGWWAAATLVGEIPSFAETASLAICRTTLHAKIG